MTNFINLHSKILILCAFNLPTFSLSKENIFSSQLEIENGLDVQKLIITGISKICVSPMSQAIRFVLDFFSLRYL